MAVLQGLCVCMEYMCALQDLLVLLHLDLLYGLLRQMALDALKLAPAIVSTRILQCVARSHASLRTKECFGARRRRRGGRYLRLQTRLPTGWVPECRSRSRS